MIHKHNNWANYMNFKTMTHKYNTNPEQKSW